MVVWSVDGDDAGSQNNANLFSRGRFQLPFLPGVAFFALRMVVLRNDLYYFCSYFESAAIFAVLLLMFCFCCCCCCCCWWCIYNPSRLFFRYSLQFVVPPQSRSPTFVFVCFPLEHESCPLSCYCILFSDTRTTHTLNHFSQQLYNKPTSEIIVGE